LNSPKISVKKSFIKFGFNLYNERFLIQQVKRQQKYFMTCTKNNITGQIESYPGQFGSVPEIVRA